MTDENKNTVTLNFAGRDDVSPYVRALVAGFSGPELTRLSLTAPDTVTASCGANKTVLAQNQAKFANIETEKDLFQLKKLLEGTSEERAQRFGFPIETLVIDTVSEFQRKMLVRRLLQQGREETVSEDWNWISNRLNKIFEGLLELDMHIIVLSSLMNVHESVAVKPTIQGSFANQIHRFVDYALLLEAKTDVLEVGSIEVDLEGNVLQLDSSEVEPVWRLRTQPSTIAPWIHADGGDLEIYIDSDLDRLIANQEILHSVLEESVQVEVEFPSEEVEQVEASESEEPEETQTEEPPVQKDEEVPGMSRQEEIMARLSNRK